MTKRSPFVCHTVRCAPVLVAQQTEESLGFLNRNQSTSVKDTAT